MAEPFTIFTRKIAVGAVMPVPSVSSCVIARWLTTGVFDPPPGPPGPPPVPPPGPPGPPGPPPAAVKHCCDDGPGEPASVIAGIRHACVPALTPCRKRSASVNEPLPEVLDDWLNGPPVMVVNERPAVRSPLGLPPSGVELLMISSACGTANDTVRLCEP